MNNVETTTEIQNIITENGFLPADLGTDFTDVAKSLDAVNGSVYENEEGRSILSCSLSGQPTRKELSNYMEGLNKIILHFHDKDLVIVGDYRGLDLKEDLPIEAFGFSQVFNQADQLFKTIVLIDKNAILLEVISNNLSHWKEVTVIKADENIQEKIKEEIDALKQIKV